MKKYTHPTFAGTGFRVLCIMIIFFSVLRLSAQDLDALLEAETSDYTDYAVATFMGSRVVTGHSVDLMQKKGLDFRIAHHFGSIKEGAEELYGLDGSNSYFTVDYGLTDWLNVGVGRATYQKRVTACMKGKILRQSTGARNMPLTLSFYGMVSATTQKFSNEDRNRDFTHRLEYTAQVLIARKFDHLSLQLSPTYVHRNLVETPSDQNDLLALGISGRYKISSILDVSAEYFWVNHANTGPVHYYNPLSFAVSYQVSHHVFQLILTNSTPIAENSALGNTTGSWLDGDVHIGFNISTVF
ncbi:MAG TPA: DUF5777 family beta-barrel protein [Prolixibacteraceae bacterium]|nr:DUF5777 family beta-barrel protein [Prolixibacteraceae bacterium]